VDDVLASPNQEQHLHVEYDENYDIGEGGQDKEKVSTFRTHYILDMRHGL
jgi:hypothetical protein